MGVRQVRHLVTGDREACGHELRGEVVLAAVAAEDGKILDQIHPFFPTLSYAGGTGMGPVCAAKGEKRAVTGVRRPLWHLLRKCHLPPKGASRCGGDIKSKGNPVKRLPFGEEEGGCGYGFFAAPAETEWSSLLLTA